VVEEINTQYAGKVSIRDVTILERGANALFHDDDERRKAYRALVQTSEAASAERMAQLATMSDLVVQQRTPVRVAHRRANHNASENRALDANSPFARTLVRTGAR
jgi:tRNA U54 and U55 pseudouridine synthase Pus10